MAINPFARLGSRIGRFFRGEGQPLAESVSGGGATAHQDAFSQWEQSRLARIHRLAEHDEIEKDPESTVEQVVHMLGLDKASGKIAMGANAAVGLMPGGMTLQTAISALIDGKAASVRGEESYEALMKYGAMRALVASEMNLEYVEDVTPAHVQQVVLRNAGAIADAVDVENDPTQNAARSAASNAAGLGAAACVPGGMLVAIPAMFGTSMATDYAIREATGMNNRTDAVALFATLHEYQKAGGHIDPVVAQLALLLRAPEAVQEIAEKALGKRLEEALSEYIAAKERRGETGNPAPMMHHAVARVMLSEEVDDALRASLEKECGCTAMEDAEKALRRAFRRPVGESMGALVASQYFTAAEVVFGDLPRLLEEQADGFGQRGHATPAVVNAIAGVLRNHGVQAAASGAGASLPIRADGEVHYPTRA